MGEKKKNRFARKTRRLSNDNACAGEKRASTFYPFIHLPLFVYTFRLISRVTRETHPARHSSNPGSRMRRGANMCDDVCKEIGREWEERRLIGECVVITSSRLVE